MSPRTARQRIYEVTITRAGRVYMSLELASSPGRALTHALGERRDLAATLQAGEASWRARMVGA